MSYIQILRTKFRNFYRSTTNQQLEPIATSTTETDQDDKEKVRAARRQYYQDHKQSMLASQKKWRQKVAAEKAARKNIA